MSSSGINSSPLPSDDATARLVIGVGLRAFRESWGQWQSLERLAPFLGKSPRRFRHWFYRDHKPIAWDEQQMRTAVAAALRWYVEYLRNRLEYWEKQADLLEANNQLVLAEDLDCQQQEPCKELAV